MFFYIFYGKPRRVRFTIGTKVRQQKSRGGAGHGFSESEIRTERLTTPALLFKSPFPPGKVTFPVSPVVTSWADVLK